MRNNSLVSIITVNYNNVETTCGLLKSIQNLTYKNIEVIVVDNASDENPESQLKIVLPNITFLRSNKNLGFAGGNNLGINIAKGEFLFFVNNDTELTPDIIQGLLEVFCLHPDAGAVSPKFHYFFHPNVIEYAGYLKVNPFTGRNSMIGCWEIDKGQYNQLTETHYAHGGAMMVPLHVINEVGRMPEEYFLYYEEFDWCEQMKKKKYKIYYQPKSLIYHKESMTTGKHSELKTYFITRNRILFMRRQMNITNLTLFCIYFICATIPKNVIVYLFRKEIAHLRAFLKGIYWNITHINLINS